MCIYIYIFIYIYIYIYVYICYIANDFGYGVQSECGMDVNTKRPRAVADVLRPFKYYQRY